MRNPYEDLGRRRQIQEVGEDVFGAFSCQEQGCVIVSSVAMYFEASRILTWECSEGHINNIKDFYIG